MSECIFCSIASGEISTEKLYETNDLIAFRDINPAAPVHILVIPKMHIESLNAVNEFSIVSKLINACVELAKKLNLEDGYRLVVNTGKSGGQTVGHLHIHLLGGRNLGWPPG